MAGGFIMRQTKWVGGQTTTVAERAQFILKAVANMLIDTGTGWSLDTTHNATVNDMMVADSNQIFVLFLVSTHGEKLMLGYSITYGTQIPAPFGFRANSNTMANISGLFTSMIPAGSTSVFGQTWLGEGFIPTDATLVYGACHYSSSGSSYITTMARANAGNKTYHAQIVTNGAIIGFRMYIDNSAGGSWWFTGPIIGTLAHPTMDTLPTAKMLTIPYYYGGTEGAGSQSYISTSTDDGSEGSNQYYWRSNVEYNNKDRYHETDLFRADGEHMQSADGHGIFWDSSLRQTSGVVSNSSITGFNRWSAYYIGICSSDPTTHYIVRGDGMKGYLDTNFLRQVNPRLYSFGQTFDDGNFVYIGNGVAMGWDATNGPLNDA